MSASGEKKAIIAAFLANLGIAVSKFVAFLLTGAASMLAEAIHSVADTGNQGLLMIGAARAKQAPDDKHPFGYANRRYFYSFIVALVLFSLGGLFAIYEGINKLRHPHEIEDLRIALGVLAFAFVLESLSIRTAIRESRPLKGRLSWPMFIRHTKSPELPVVLLEDLGALIGLVLAMIGVGMSQITDEPRWDAAGSLAIGILLVIIAGVLVIEMSSLLLGEAALPEDVAKIENAFTEDPNVNKCIHLRTEHIGPEQIVVAAKLEFRRDLTMEQLADAIDAVEARIRAALPTAHLIFIEPDIYRAPAAN